MTKVTFLPHETICPEGKVIEVAPGTPLLQAALDQGIEIEHACGMVCACTTCHIIVREGFDALNEAEEREEDMLDRAWGLESTSRLSCQTIVGDTDLVVEIPRYSLNQVSEKH